MSAGEGKFEFAQSLQRTSQQDQVKLKMPISQSPVILW